MSKTILNTTLALIKMSVPLAPGMLLTDTFVATGRSAMLLDPAPSASPGAAAPDGGASQPSGHRRPPASGAR